MRRLPSGTVAALADAGLLTLCLPRAYGGPGVSPVELIDAVAEVARGDGAAGWCAAIASTTASMAAFLPPDAAATVYPSPATATGGVFAPNGRGVRVDDGFSVTGRWQWGSGTQHCSWIVGGAMCDDGTQRVCFFPASDVQFHDTWHSVGLRGTGSLDFSVEGAARALDAFTVRAGVAADTRRRAAGALPELHAAGARYRRGRGRGRVGACSTSSSTIAASKTPQFSSRTLANSGFAQTEFARAEAQWRSARAYPARRGRLGVADGVRRWPGAASRPRVAIRLAAAHAAASCVAVTDTAFTLAGGTAVYETSVLGRCVRDVHVDDAAHHGRPQAQRDARQAPARRRVRRIHDLNKREWSPAWMRSRRS